MRMLSFYSNRSPSVTAGALVLAVAAVIAGCASKNPLIDEPVVTSKSPASQAPTAKQDQTPVPVQTAEAQAAPTASDLQTTRQRRFLGIFSPYRPDIQQGNFVSREMVAQLKEGMTPDQVRFVLGTPLLTDIFHANRWDYPFRLIQGNGKVTSSHVTVYFKDNRLARIEGGDLPTEKDFLFLIAGEGTAAGTSTGATPRPASPVPARQTSPAPTDPINRRR
jgi:outer membrane protein assembly factor BamE